MGYLLILLIVFVASFIITKITTDEWFEIVFLLSFLSALVIGGIFVLIVAAFVHSTFPDEEYISNKTHIVALNDNITTQGTFFLGSGTVDGEMTYFYMVKKSKGMKIEKISADNAYIIEENRKDGLIEETGVRFKNKRVEYWFPNWYSGDTLIKIPKGSIIQNYKVDLQ